MKLKKLFLDYGTHQNDCGTEIDGHCTCGYAQAYEDIKKVSEPD